MNKYDLAAIGTKCEAVTMKTLLVGEANPYGSDPKFALYPAPIGSAGQRLCCVILGMRRVDYLKSFDRINLCDRRWSLKEARRRAEEIWSTPSAPRVILCGAKAAQAWSVPFVPFEVSEGGTVLVLPHPSGLNRLWNNQDAVSQTRLAVAAFDPEIAKFIGRLERKRQ